MLIAEKHRLLEAATESTLSSLEIGLIGGSAVLTLVAISLLVYVIYGAICRRRMTKRITKRIRAQAELPREGDVGELWVRRGPNNESEEIQPRGDEKERGLHGDSETRRKQAARALSDQRGGLAKPNPMDGKGEARPPREQGHPEGAAGRGQAPVDALPRVPSTRRTRGSENDQQ